MEDIAQKSIQAKNKTIADLQEEIAELKAAIDQRNKHIQAMAGDIQTAKSRLKSQGVHAASDDLLDLIDANQQQAAEDLRRRTEGLRELDAKIAAVDGDRRDLKNQLDFYKKREDDLRRIITGAASDNPRGGRADDRDVVSLLEDRLAHEDRNTRERENALMNAQAKINELRGALEDKDRQIQKLQAERGDALDRLRGARDAILSSQVGNKFKFVQPQTARGLNDSDLAAVMDNRDREIVEELNARDDELAEMRSRLRALEEAMAGKQGEIESVKQDLVSAERERDAKLAEIQGLNEHARTQANVIRRKIEELEEKDGQVADSRSKLKQVEKELEDKNDQIESAEEELRARDEQIGGLQRKLQRAQEDIGSKLVVLSLLLEKLTAAKEEFEARDDEIDECSQKLVKVEEERRNMEDTLKRYKDDEISIMHDNTVQFGRTDDDTGEVRRNRSRNQEDEELDRLFKSARHTLGVLGEKANFSFAALKTKDDLDSLYHEQLTVTGAEMILRDRKINLLVEKIEVAERYLNELLKILGQRGLMKYGSQRQSIRNSSGSGSQNQPPSAYIGTVPDIGSAAASSYQSQTLGGGIGVGGGGIHSSYQAKYN